MGKILCGLPIKPLCRLVWEDLCNVVGRALEVCGQGFVWDGMRSFV